MKFSAGLALAAILVAGAASESTNMLTVDPKTLTRVDPDMIRGPGPTIPAENNPKVDLAGSNNGNYDSIDPHSLPNVDPKYLRIGPVAPAGDNSKLWTSTDELTTQSGSTNKPDATTTAPPTLWRID